MSSFAVFFEGVDVDILQGIDSNSRRLAAARAINKAARDARSRAAALIRDQVNLPASYVSPGNKRLYVSKNASRESLEARITAQGRATSLARFSHGSPKVGKPGVFVEVSPGKARFMKRAFLIKLPQGDSAVTDTRYNLGLAIRLRPGETIRNKSYAKRIDRGLFALYGPSVNQVFRANSGKGVASDMAPEVANRLTDEFLRLLDI